MSTLTYRSAVIGTDANTFTVFEDEAEKAKKFPFYCYVVGGVGFAVMAVFGNVVAGIAFGLFCLAIGWFITRASQQSRRVEIDRDAAVIKITHTDQGTATEEVLSLAPFNTIELAFCESTRNIGENTDHNTTAYRVMLRRELTEELVDEVTSEHAQHLNDAMKVSPLAKKLVTMTVAGAGSNYVSIGTDPTTNRAEAVALAESLQDFLAPHRRVEIDERYNARLFPKMRPDSGFRVTRIGGKG